MTLRRAILTGTVLWLTAGAVAAQASADAAKPAIILPNGTAAAQYDTSSGFPERNGPLSGMVIVIPQQEVDEFNKPAGGERQLNRVARAEPGAVLAVKLVFVGVASDWDDNVDVTYDLRITAPDGKPYGDAFSLLSAAKGKMGRESGVYDNRNKVVLIQFEDQDVPGVYRIDATLRDRIGGISLPLTTQVELIAKATVGTSEVAPPAAASSAPVAMAPIPDPQPQAKPVVTKKKYRKKRRR